MKGFILLGLVMGLSHAYADQPMNVIYDEKGGYALSSKKKCRVLIRTVEKDDKEVVQLAVITKKQKKQMKVSTEYYDSVMQNLEGKKRVELITDSSDLLEDFGKATIKFNDQGEVKTVSLETGFTFSLLHPGNTTLSCYKLDQ